MTSKVKAHSWHTARQLHQIQLLSCDLSELTAWQSPNHAAPFWRLYWHNHDGAFITVAGRALPLRRGVITLIPPHTEFSSRLTRPVEQFFLHFLIDPSFDSPLGRVYQILPDRDFRDLQKRIIALLRSDASNIHASLLAQILVSIALLHLPGEHWTQRFEDARITRAVTAIRAAYPGWIGNTALAKQASLQPSSFIRVFRTCTGRTPVEFLMGLRLEEACTMLHYSDATLEEIAERVGFCDRAHFSRMFSARMNCTPARYRHLVNSGERLRPDAQRKRPQVPKIRHCRPDKSARSFQLRTRRVRMATNTNPA